MSADNLLRGLLFREFRIGELKFDFLEGLLAAMNFSQGVQKIIYGIVLFLAVMISSRRKGAGNE